MSDGRAHGERLGGGGGAGGAGGGIWIGGNAGGAGGGGGEAGVAGSRAWTWYQPTASWAAAAADETQSWRRVDGIVRVDTAAPDHSERLSPAEVVRLEAEAAVERQAERRAERLHDYALARLDHESRLVRARIGPVVLVMPAYLALAGLLLGWPLAAAVVLR